MKIKVADVTQLSFHGYDWEQFNTLAEAFAWIAQEIEDYADDEDYAEQFEIKIPGGGTSIQIDARHVEFATLYPEED